MAKKISCERIIESTKNFKMVPLVILILSLVSFGDASSINYHSSSNIGTIEENINRLYGNNLTNFKNTLACIDNVDGSFEKITAFQALVGAMKDSDHLYSPEIMQFAHKFKQFIDESKDISKSSQQQIEDIKQVLPGSVQTMAFCSSFKIKQVDLNQYLGPDRTVKDLNNRYVFFTDNPKQIGTDYTIVKSSTVDDFKIKNILLDEYLYIFASNDVVVQYIPENTLTTLDIATELVHGTDYVKLRGIHLNQYIYDSGVFINGKRLAKGAPKPERSRWYLQCS